MNRTAIIAVFAFSVAFAELRDDGSKFMIDRPFEVKHFKVWGERKADTWGFVNENTLPLNHKGYDEILSKCDFSKNSKSFASYSSMSTLIYYPTTPDFNSFKGIDMVPENKNNYVRGSFFGAMADKSKHAKHNETIQIKQCRIPMTKKSSETKKEVDDGAWHVQRVGPFLSEGGYDWWQLGWSDVGMLKEVLAMFPEGIDITSTIMTPVLEDGFIYIHIHHIHVVEQNGVRPRNVMAGVCLKSSGATSITMDTAIKEKNCYNSSLFFEQHGDYQCQPEDDGMDCLTSGDHKVRRIRQPLDVEGDLNDVRPFNSPDLRWYYQVAFRWKPIDKTVRPVSQQTIMAPGNAIASQQLTRVVTFPTPTNNPHFIWYTGKFWADGEAVRNKLHAHNLVFESSAFFLASPKDLGLDKPLFMPKRSYDPFPTTALGFKDNQDLSDHILKNLAASQAEYDRVCTGDQKANNERCQFPRPRWVCAAVFDSEEFFYDYTEKNDPHFRGRRGFKMDRRPRTWCEPFDFKKGDPFTVASFSRQLKRAPIPPYPDRIPPTIPGHVSWHFWYHHSGWFHSAFGRIVCNQEGIFFDAADQYGVIDLPAFIGSVLLHGGIPTTYRERNIIKYSLISVLVGIVLFIVYCGVKQKKE